MIRQVYDALKVDGWKGDFVNLITKDFEDLNIDITEEDIILLKKIEWEKYINKIIKENAFEYLVKENNEKSKTKHIYFEKLEMSNYLVINKSTSLSKIIFSVRAGIYDVNIWNDWNYSETLCVMCNLLEKNMDHFMHGSAYGENPCEINWKNIFENNPDEQNEIAMEIKKKTVPQKI